MGLVNFALDGPPQKLDNVHQRYAWAWRRQSSRNRRYQPCRETVRGFAFGGVVMARLKALPPRLAPAKPRLGFADRVEAKRDWSRRRQRSKVSRKWYNSKRWQDLRQSILVRDHYICQQTGALLKGKRHAPDSPVVDHIIPHNDDPALFWDPDNLQSVSKEWHDSVKQSQERRERARGRGA